MKKTIVIILILITILSLSSCVKTKSALGSIGNDSIYINNYFNFKISLPSNWKYYNDDERYDITVNYNESQTQTKLQDFSDADTILLMILYRDEIIEESDGEHGHQHITPILSPGLIINAVKGKNMPDNTVAITINSFTMYQEDIINDNEMYTNLYYLKDDFTILFKLNYKDVEQALLVMDILNTISPVK